MYCMFIPKIGELSSDLTCASFSDRLGRSPLGPIDVRGGPTRWGGGDCCQRSREGLVIPSPTKKNVTKRKQGKQRKHNAKKGIVTLNWLFPTSKHFSQHEHAEIIFPTKNGFRQLPTTMKFFSKKNMYLPKISLLKVYIKPA